MAVQTPMSLSEYANAIDAGVRQSFIDKFTQHKPRLELVAEVGTLTDYNQFEANFTGLGLPELTGESEMYKQDASLQGFTTTYTPAKYTKSVPITEELVAFDKTGITSKSTIGSQMAEVFTAHIENEAAKMFKSGFDTAITSYSDGKPLFSTNHTRVDAGSAFSNASSTGIALTHDNLTAAMNQVQSTTNDRGVLIMMRPTILLVPTALESQALEIVKSSGRSDTADRADNVFGMREYIGGMLKVVVWPYLDAANGGSDTAWFLLTENKVLQWKWAPGLKPQLGLVDKTNENKNGEVAFVGKYMAAKGWGNPRGIWGSKGDGQAYAS